MSRIVHTLPMLTLAAGALLASASANAVTKQRSFTQNATGACQSALPVFDGQIRKRPLAVQNEGTASAFVSCSFVGTIHGVGGTTPYETVFLYADNNTASPVNLTCTLIDGVSGFGAGYFPKTITMAANSKLNELTWTAADNSGNNFFYTTNVSCNLPVGTGLSVYLVYFDEDVGA